MFVFIPTFLVALKVFNCFQFVCCSLELQKSMETNKLLQATAQAAQAQHSSLLHTAATQAESWGKSCTTTVIHVQQALRENERSQQLNTEHLKEARDFITTAQNQITESVAETSGSISQEVKASREKQRTSESRTNE